MKTFLKLLLLLPALVQSADIPIMGTAPSQPTAAPASVSGSPDQGQKKAKAPTAAKPVKSHVQVLPPPSQVTKDFYEAFTRGNPQMADMLLQQGADINCRNCGDHAPLTRSAFLGDVNGIKWLLSRGADANVLSGNAQVTPLMAAVGREAALTLLQGGANPNVQDLGGNSAFLAWSSRNGWNVEYRLPVLSKMLESGADINQVNNLGYSALMIAIGNSGDCVPDLAQFLLEHGANPKLRAADGKTAETIAYKIALAGSQSCNQVIALLQTPHQGQEQASSPTTKPEAMGAANVQPSSGTRLRSLSGEWQGVFNATAPRQGSVDMTAVFANSGEVIFSSQSGLRGSGRLSVVGGQVNGSFTAKSPLDAQGKPVFTNPDGSTDILFTLTGSLANGMIRGKYASAIEQGIFAMCDGKAYQQTPECRTAQVNPADLLKAVGGLLGTLRGLSGTGR